MVDRKSIVARIMKCGKSRVWIDPERLGDINNAITAADLRKLIKDGAIRIKPITGNSRGRINKKLTQKSKGRRKGPGSRKGKKTARTNEKKEWMIKVRKLRTHLRALRDKGLLTDGTYRNIYRKIGSGMFRGVNHMEFYLKDHDLLKVNENEVEKKTEQ